MQGYSEYGKQVKIAMVSLGLSSRELARLLGYHEATLCDLLKGRNRNEERMAEVEAVLARLQKEKELEK